MQRSLQVVAPQECSSGIYSNLACHDSGDHVEACVAQLRFLRGRPAPRDTGAERDAER
jgi:hypothetical protein